MRGFIKNDPVESSRELFAFEELIDAKPGGAKNKACVLHKRFSVLQQQISGWLKKQMQEQVSHETIYKHILADKKRGGILYKCLRHSEKNPILFRMSAMTSIGKVNQYGSSEPHVVLIHGGPGAPGELKPIGEELARRKIGSLEPFQTAKSLEGQIEELKDQIQAHCRLPTCLLGYSWGAMLALLTAAKYPHLANKVILVSSACFDELYASSIRKRRLNRLSTTERRALEECLQSLNNPSKEGTVQSNQKLYTLIIKSDCFDPINTGEPVTLQTDIYKAVWPKAVELRKNGELLKRIAAFCGPVVALHGDYDPHPSNGIKIPLANTLSQFSFIEIPNCGHIPWIERSAAPIFFDLLQREIPPISS